MRHKGLHERAQANTIVVAVLLIVFLFSVVHDPYCIACDGCLHSRAELVDDIQNVQN